MGDFFLGWKPVLSRQEELCLEKRGPDLPARVRVTRTQMNSLWVSPVTQPEFSLFIYVFISDADPV